MYRLKEDHIEELEIKKSRFITYLHRCFSEQEAKDYIVSIRKLHPNASHHCYAFIIGERSEIQRSNDDGEPSGTAGLPMLESLAQQNIQDIVAITVRYFGGIKLGGGGLIRAYAKSVHNALDHAIITRKQAMKKCSIRFSYGFVGKLDYFFRQEAIEVLHKDYQETVQYTFLCQEIPNEAIAELTSGLYMPEFIEDVILDIEIIR